MCVLKQRGSDVFIRGTFIGNIHQEPSILLTLYDDDDDDDDSVCVESVHVCTQLSVSCVCLCGVLVFGAEWWTDVQCS